MKKILSGLINLGILLIIIGLVINYKEEILNVISIIEIITLIILKILVIILQRTKKKLEIYTIHL